MIESTGLGIRWPGLKCYLCHLFQAKYFKSLWLHFLIYEMGMIKTPSPQGAKWDNSQTGLGKGACHEKVLSKYWLLLFFHPHDCQENHSENEGQNHALNSEISGQMSKQACPVFSGASEWKPVKTTRDSSLHLLNEAIVIYPIYVNHSILFGTIHLGKNFFNKKIKY